MPYARLRSSLGSRRPLLTDHVRLRTLLEESAIDDPSLFFAMFLHHCMTTGAALDQGATEEDVAALTSGRWIGATLLAELGRGNSNSRTHTEAVHDPATRDFVLSTPTPEATKYPANVGEPGVARLAVVSACLLVAGTYRGTALFLVALRDEHGPCPGVTIKPLPPTALLPMDYATVHFDGVRVPHHRWLADGASISEDGSFHDPLPDAETRSRRSMTMGRFGWGAITAGLAAVARASVALALTHAANRRTLDRLAGEVRALDHLNQQRQLFSAATAALAATVLARRDTTRCWTIPSALSPPDLRQLGLNKVTVTLLADSAVALSRSACGGAAFFSENRLLAYQALSQAFQSAGGDNRLNLLDAAWTMATGVGYTPPNDNPAPDDWLTLFRTRERLLHTELTTGLTANFHTWNNRTELAQRFAESHASRVAAEILHAEWHAQPLVADLYELHCVEQVHAHAGWYLANDLITAKQLLDLPNRTNELCRRLLPHADTLTTLLEIPDSLLSNPPGSTGLLALG